MAPIPVGRSTVVFDAEDAVPHTGGLSWVSLTISGVSIVAAKRVGPMLFQGTADGFMLRAPSGGRELLDVSLCMDASLDNHGATTLKAIPGLRQCQLA
jgi:hypothetical protein